MAPLGASFSVLTVVSKSRARNELHVALSPAEWKSAYWAQEHGLYTKVYESRSELNSEAEFFASQLASYSPDALSLMKKALWEGTDHWDTLLSERASLTGKLALTKTTQDTLKKLKRK